MGTRKVRLWPDPVLMQVCAPVDPADPAVTDLIKNLFDTMYAANGRGLAASQIGVLKRVFVVDVSWKEGTRAPMAFVNPQLENVSAARTELDEQCLSIPDLPMTVSRPDKIELHWDDPQKGRSSANFAGLIARCIQHELDHLNGTVIFDHQSADVRHTLEARYAT